MAAKKFFIPIEDLTENNLRSLVSSLESGQDLENIETLMDLEVEGVTVQPSLYKSFPLVKAKLVLPGGTTFTKFNMRISGYYAAVEKIKEQKGIKPEQDLPVKDLPVIKPEMITGASLATATVNGERVVFLNAEGSFNLGLGASDAEKAKARREALREESRKAAAERLSSKAEVETPEAEEAEAEATPAAKAKPAKP